jgi:iron complex outermembrane receptor protein
MRFRPIGPSLALVTILSLSTPAFAETISDTAFEQDARSSAGTGDTDAPDEIVVTARRRNETAQEIPIAVSVVGGDQIDNTGSFNVGRLQQLTPTLQFYSSNPRNTSVNIRGIGVPFGTHQ